MHGNDTSILASGGVVMLPLLLFSLMSLMLIGERLWFWWRVTRQQRPLLLTVLELYPARPDAAIAHLEARQHLPLARIFLTTLQLPVTDSEQLRLALETATQRELPLLRRFNTVFETVIAISPLLGLLGTLLGLMRIFVNLNLANVGGFAAEGVTRGIAEALISTATGLAIAIFTLFFANLFRGLSRRQQAFIQVAGGELELRYRQQQAEAQSVLTPEHEANL